MEVNKIICGDALEILKTLPDNSIQCCVTSPPYYGLRDYGHDKQIGLEGSISEYLKNLINVFSEVKRVLKPNGILWVNISDSYSGSTKGAARYPDNAKLYLQGTNKGGCGVPKITNIKSNLPKKNLMLIPQRFVIAMQDTGWIVRDEIIWAKPNPMPESVKDRLTASYERIYMFTKNRKYYFDANVAMEPAVGFNNEPIAGSKGAFGIAQSRRRKGNRKTFRGTYINHVAYDNDGNMLADSIGNMPNESGMRKMRNVWNIATVNKSTNKIKHYAKFPDELAKRCILLSSQENDVVLDPFAGSGTTCRIANQHGRKYIGIEINKKYCKAAEADIPINLF